MTRRSEMDWRSYTSTLSLTILMQRVVLELLEAAHAGDADAAISASIQLRQMAAVLVLDFGIDVDDEANARLIAAIHKAALDCGITASPGLAAHEAENRIDLALARIETLRVLALGAGRAAS